MRRNCKNIGCSPCRRSIWPQIIPILGQSKTFHACAKATKNEPGGDVRVLSQPLSQIIEIFSLLISREGLGPTCGDHPCGRQKFPRYRCRWREPELQAWRSCWHTCIAWLRSDIISVSCSSMPFYPTVLPLDAFISGFNILVVHHLESDATKKANRVPSRTAVLWKKQNE